MAQIGIKWDKYKICMFVFPILVIPFKLFLSYDSSSDESENIIFQI